MKALQKTAHPHIMSVFEMVQDDEKIYMACEYLEGGELRKFIY